MIFQRLKGCVDNIQPFYFSKNDTYGTFSCYILFCILKTDDQNYRYNASSIMAYNHKLES